MSDEIKDGQTGQDDDREHHERDNRLPLLLDPFIVLHVSRPDSLSASYAATAFTMYHTKPPTPMRGKTAGWPAETAG